MYITSQSVCKWSTQHSLHGKHLKWKRKGRYDLVRRNVEVPYRSDLWDVPNFSSLLCVHLLFSKPFFSDSHLSLEFKTKVITLINHHRPGN